MFYKVLYFEYHTVYLDLATLVLIGDPLGRVMKTHLCKVNKVNVNYQRTRDHRQYISYTIDVQYDYRSV